MALTPDDTFLISSSTALGMAENLVVLLNTVVKNLPEPELRQVRGALENSVRLADELLYNIAISSTFEMLTLSDGMFSLPSAPIRKQTYSPESVRHPWRGRFFRKCRKFSHSRRQHRYDHLCGSPIATTFFHSPPTRSDPLHLHRLLL